MHGIYGMHWGMGIGWFALAAVLFFAGWIIGRYVYMGNRTKQEDGNSALNILKERYARGEISKEEYLEKKTNIS